MYIYKFSTFENLVFKLDNNFQIALNVPAFKFFLYKVDKCRVDMSDKFYEYLKLNYCLFQSHL